MFVFAAAAAVCISFSLVAVGATTIRQRRTAQPSDQEEPQPDELPKPAAAAGRSSKIGQLVAVLLSVLGVAMAGTLLYFLSGLPSVVYDVLQQLLHPHAGAGQWQSTCVPLSTEERASWYQLAGFSFPILTESDTAQNLFQQGLLLEYDFNQVEALNAFNMAIEADPECAMCHWGVAYALGPFPNKVAHEHGEKYPVFSPQDLHAAQSAAMSALQYAQLDAVYKPNSEAALRGLDFALAMAQRFANGTEFNPERDAAERAYSAAMTAAAEMRQDAHAYAIAAEARYLPVAWAAYDEHGELKPDAAAAEQLARIALKLDPLHPLANHLLIHISEAARPGRGEKEAGRAEFAADALNGAYTDFGHLLHMPSHMFIRLGRWQDAIDASVKAHQADVHNAARCLVVYDPEHNINMLVFAASMSGQWQLAEEYAQVMQVLEARFGASVWPDSHEALMLPFTLVRHAQWERIVREARSPRKGARGVMPLYGRTIATILFHHTKVMAHAAKYESEQAKGTVGKAKDSLRLANAYVQTMNSTLAQLPPDEATSPGVGIGIYSGGYHAIASILYSTSLARLALASARTGGHEGGLEMAEALLRRAAEEEDALIASYIEPPRIPNPSRQCLAWLLLHRAKYKLAEEQYRLDLAEYPSNGYSLYGLAQSLKAQGGRGREYATVASQFKAAWQRADAKLLSSCPAFSAY